MGNISRRNFILGSVAVGLSAGNPVWAESYPSRPIRVIVPFGPGGLTDSITRALGKNLSEKLGQPIVVENQPSAGQIVAMQSVARARPDGYTLIMGTTTGFSVTPNIYGNLTYETRGFVPVAPVSMSSNVVVVRPDFPANDLKEFWEYAKSKNGDVSYASFGVGTSPHLGMEMYEKVTGVKLLHIPYKGDSGALLALMSGEVDVAVITSFAANPRVKSGEIKGLGVLRAQPDQSLPQLQTTMQAGAPNVDLPSWIGLFAPSGTPSSVVDVLEQAARAVVAEQAFQEFLVDRGSEAMAISNEEWMKLISHQRDELGEIIGELGLRQGS